MEIEPATAATATPLFTCQRCGDKLVFESMVAPSATCPACIRLLGERALARLVPVRRVLAGLLTASAAVACLSLVSSVLQIALLERMQVGDFTQAETESNDLRESAIGVLELALYIATAIAWCIWFRRSHDFVTVGGRQMEFGRNAWGWFFMPFANLYKPYEAVRELWQRATGLARGARPAILPVWWGVWLLSSLTGNVSMRMSLKASTEIPALITVSNVQAVDAAAGIVVSVAALFAVRAIDRALRIDEPEPDARR